MVAAKLQLVVMATLSSLNRTKQPNTRKRTAATPLEMEQRKKPWCMKAQFTVVRFKRLFLEAEKGLELKCAIARFSSVFFSP